MDPKATGHPLPTEASAGERWAGWSDFAHPGAGDRWAAPDHSCGLGGLGSRPGRGGSLSPPFQPPAEAHPDAYPHFQANAHPDGQADHRGNRGPTLAAIQTVHPGSRGGQAGSGNGGAQAADGSLGALLGWGLGALVVALLAFGLFLVRFTRRMARQHQQPAFAPPVPGPTPARLTQLHQVLPAREAAPLLEEGDTWEPRPPGQETPSVSALKPPRWMIEAGLLKEDTSDQPAADPPESSGQGGR